MAKKQKLAAIQYCKYASEYAETSSGKAWEYIVIPHSQVKLSNDLSYFTNRFTEN